MSPETKAAIARMKPQRYVWCQHGQQPGMRNDEHQVCLDREAAHRKRGGTSWGCTCRCHR